MGKALELLRLEYGFPAEKPNVPERTHGFFEPDNAAAFDRVCGPHVKIYLEMGTWLGKSVRYVLDRCPNAIAICLDEWYVPKHRENFDFLPHLWETFLVNCWEYRDRIIPIRMATGLGVHEVVKCGVQPDLCYIDAGHDYFNVLNDVTNCAWQFPNATLVLDDNEPLHGPGVVPVTREFDDIVDRVYEKVCVTSECRVPIYYPPKTPHAAERLRNCR